MALMKLMVVALAGALAGIVGNAAFGSEQNFATAKLYRVVDGSCRMQGERGG